MMLRGETTVASSLQLQQLAMYLTLKQQGPVVVTGARQGMDRNGCAGT